MIGLVWECVHDEFANHLKVGVSGRTMKVQETVTTDKPHYEAAQ